MGYELSVGGNFASRKVGREMGPGAVWRMEYVRGKGHHTRVISDEPFLAAIVQHE